MDLHIPGDYQRRLRERQRQDILQWVLTRADEPGIQTGQIIDSGFVESLLRPAQSVLQAVLDDPSGDRIHLTLHPNGSLSLELDFDILKALDESALADYLPVLQTCISDLFHADELQFNHAVVCEESGFILRTISSVTPQRSLTELVCEMQALKETLLALLQRCLSGENDAS